MLSSASKEKNKKFFKEKSDELDSPTQLHDNWTRDDEEAKDDFWTITREFIHRHLVVPPVKLYWPREEPFPDEHDGEVGEGVVEEDLADKPETTNGT